MDFATLPSWALDTMLACARGAERKDLERAVSEVRDNRLFEESEDSVWYAGFRQFGRAQPRGLTPPESWLPVPKGAVAAVFGPEGELARQFERYEPRAGQTAMAEAVADALSGRRFLLAEAGTGVGKSLAYLVPSALWAVRNNLPVVISTNTRNLQTQLIAKDAPLVSRIIAPWLPKDRRFTAVTLKGRGNYLCLRRFGILLEEGLPDLSPNELLLFSDLTAWAARTRDGDLDTFHPEYGCEDPAFRHSLGCQADTCTGKKCRFAKRCFLLQARQNAQAADLIVTNHALVFSELSGDASVLPPHAQVVFDEAHNLENAATQFFTEELSPFALYDFCQRLAPGKGREAYGILERTRKDFIETAVPDPAEQVGLTALLADIRACGADLAKRGTELLETLQTLTGHTPDHTVRYRCVPAPGRPPLPDGSPALRREVCLSGSLFTPAEPLLPEAEIDARRTAVAEQLSLAHRLLERLLAEIARRAPQQPGENPFEELTASVTALGERIESFGKTLSALLDGTRSDCVYWIARCTGQRQEHLVTLTAAPLDIAERLRGLLYGERETIVFSSATLRIGGTFAHLRRRLGLENEAVGREIREFVAESPFDYPRQCCVAVPGFLPEVEDPSYTLELSRMMYSLFVTARGRSLALFTSYEMMRVCAERLAPFLRDRGIRLLTQDTAPRDAITEALRANGEPTVLFGTQSFWEGVDVAGDALSCVVIARLPFESYGDPLFKARCDRIRERGGVPFAELALPQAVIRFRQGFGRLIRSRSDRGIVVVADARITRKSYGTVFARSLPCPVEVIASRPALAARLAALLAPESP